jgi:hypothetical protein
MRRPYLALISAGGAVAALAAVGVVLLLRRSASRMTGDEIDSIRATLSATTAAEIDGETWDLVPSASTTTIPPPSENALAVARGIAGRGATAVVWSNLQRMFALDAGAASDIDGKYVAPGVVFLALPRGL